MASPSSPVLQKLDRLDTSSSDFDDQLCSFFSGREYVQCVSDLSDEDLVWLVDYLDEVCQCVSFPFSTQASIGFKVSSIFRSCFSKVFP